MATIEASLNEAHRVHLEDETSLDPSYDMAIRIIRIPFDLNLTSKYDTIRDLKTLRGQAAKSDDMTQREFHEDLS